MRTAKNRVCLILYGLENVLDGILGDHWPINHEAIEQWVAGGGKGAIFAPRTSPKKWHPAYWLAFVRCQWLGDKCGSGMFKEGAW